MRSVLGRSIGSLLGGGEKSENTYIQENLNCFLVEKETKKILGKWT